MPRIAPLDNETAPPDTRAAAEAHVRNHARMTNMKRTLLHSLPAFRALMEWYPLRDSVQPFLGERLTTLFAHAISAETGRTMWSWETRVSNYSPVLATGGGLLFNGGMDRYLRHNPGDAKYFSVKTDANGNPSPADIAHAAERNVQIRIHLEATPFSTATAPTG